MQYESNPDYFQLAMNELSLLDQYNSYLTNSMYAENALIQLEKIYKSKKDVLMAVKHILIGYGKLYLFECVFNEYL
jgi:hypothetical protein